MTDNAMVLATNSGLMPALSIQSAIARYNAVLEFTKTVMKPGKDFGVVPGTDKPTLLKPGAEKLCSLFDLYPKFNAVDKIVDFDKGLFYFQYECVLHRNGNPVASGLGSCNSKEKKYRYRSAERKCPACGKPAIIKGKTEYGGGWICFAKKGGCGAKFGDTDPAIIDQQVGQIENTEPFDLINTIDKMAQKRALVAATLIGANASEFFTQDVEDMDYIEGHYTEVSTSKPVTVVQPSPNGHKPTQPPEPEPEPEPAFDNSLPVMEFDTACNVKNSKGTLYGDIDTATLSHMANAIHKELGKAKGAHDDNEIVEYQYKLSAIQTILAMRRATS